MTTFSNEAEFLAEHGNTREEAERRIYKYTDCGAWITFEDDGVTIGSIVEGADIGTASYRLVYPFSETEFSARMDAIEKEAAALWEWANEERDDGLTDAERGLDAPTARGVKFIFPLPEVSEC